MNKSLSNQLKELKSALLTLNASGEEGFEGLVAVTLNGITGVPFRLAASGRQFGVDGKSAYDEDSICFEAKRYDGAIPRTEVITKIADLARNNLYPDLVWVLGATSSVKTQLADDIRTDGRKTGISVLILDWSKTELPSLATALAMGGHGVEDFLKSNIINTTNQASALSALKAIRADSTFNAHTKRIKVELDAPAIGIAIAHDENIKWLTEGFSSRKCARHQFGQPLSPNDNSSTKIIPRKALSDKLQPFLSGTPDEKVIFILGGEGCGKSWIIPQSWLVLDSKPLMLFFSADEFQESAKENDIEELLITKIIEQSSEKKTEASISRWNRRLSYWHRNLDISYPRLILIIDGINQKPNVDWGKVIDKTADLVDQIGGRLFITSRTSFFRERVKRRLTVDTIEIEVPEWVSSERDEILLNYDINPTVLHPAVAQSLLNPRLLGIAVELLNKDDITSMEELSVSRLLFEHIRANELDAATPQPVDVFVRKLRDHAQKIIDRKQKMQEDDLNVFEVETSAVADGRFFHPVEGEPEKYQLKEDGLTLALGFSIIDRLKTAKRNQRNLDETLTTLLEPISALDSTAEVVLAALTVSVIDDQPILDLVTVLVKGFSNLQNPDQTKFPAFVGLTKIKPMGFMKAAHDLCLNGASQQNFDWIKFAIIEVSKSSDIWSEISSELHCWLSAYSLSPEYRMQSHHAHGSIEKIQVERVKKQEIIDEKLKAFSQDEKNILKQPHQKDGDINALTHLGISILAGKPLAPFAESFINWSFSTAFNADYSAPHKDFMHLISLNRIDWKETQRALLNGCEGLRGNEISRTGKWALVTILRATGNTCNDKEAQELVAELTKGKPNFPGWRRNEKYCATDPCAPESVEPENILQTAEQYKAADVSKVQLFMGQTSEDLFFNDTRPGMARFKPKETVVKHQELIENVLSRNNFPLRQGIFELEKHKMLLTPQHAKSLVLRWQKSKQDNSLHDLTKQDNWIVSQYFLLLAFPLLNATEQIKILLLIKQDEDILLDLLRTMKPLDATSFEQLFTEARKNKDEYIQELLLLVAKETNTPISIETQKYIVSLINANSARLRTEALGVIAQSDDEDILYLATQSNWNAANVNKDDHYKHYEEWYGSIVLLEAAKRNLINHEEILDRISPRLYGRAALLLNTKSKQEIARRIDASIKHTIGLKGSLVAPDIELEVLSDEPYEPNSFSVSEKVSPIQTITETMQRVNDTSLGFEERQKRNIDTFIEFENTLTQAKAQIILDGLRLSEFTAIVTASDGLGDEWFKIFIDLSDSNLSFLHNIILLLAYVLSDKYPDKSRGLFEKIRDNKPIVRMTFSLAGIELDAMTIWSGEGNDALIEQRSNRLDFAGTDHDLSMEVLAASMNRQQEFLKLYILEKLKSEEPAEIARGVLVAGFSGTNEFNTKVLSDYQNYEGLVGSAYKASKYAYERNCWASHWFEKMCITVEPNETWCYEVLFKKIVDARFILWRKEYSPINTSISSYKPDLKKRFKRWEDQRKKKLFGNDAPAKIFLKENN